MEDLFPLESSWMVAAGAGLIALIMLLRLARPLPFQNLLVIAVTLLGGQGLIEWLVVKVGKTFIPDPRWHYFAGAAILWTAVVLFARRMAKFVARPWRKEKVHWLWIIFLTMTGTMAFQIGWPLLDPDFGYQSRLLAMAGVRGLGTAVLLACLAPWFIRKRPYPGKDFSELADQPEDETENDADEQTSG